METNSISKSTILRVESAKAYIEQKFSRLKEQQQKKRRDWDTLNQRMTQMNLSCSERNLVTRQIQHSEAEKQRKKRQKLSIYDFQPLSIIGKGAYGQVRLCRHRLTGEILAVKKMRKSEMKSKNQVKHIKAQRDILAKANNSWIVGLKYSFQDEQFLYLCMEYLAGGDFMTLLMKKEIFSESEARFYAAEIVLALQSTHNLNYIHRDLKPDNILLDNQGHIKLSDFGLCAFAEVVPFSIQLRRSIDDPSLPQPSLLSIPKQKFKRQRLLAQSTVGTPDYIAPEVFLKKGYNESVDWWSFGVILFQMLVGYPPFYSQDPSTTCQKIVNWKKTMRIPREARLSPQATDLIIRLVRDPKDRLGKNGVHEIKNHPFFDGVNWNSIRSEEAPYKPEISCEVDTRHFEDFNDDEPFYPEGVGRAKRRDLEFIGYTFKKETQRDQMLSALKQLERIRRVSNLTQC